MPVRAEKFVHIDQESSLGSIVVDREKIRSRSRRWWDPFGREKVPSAIKPKQLERTREREPEAWRLDDVKTLNQSF